MVNVYRVWLGNDASFLAVGLNGQERPVVGVSRTSGAHACVDLWGNATTLPDATTHKRKGAKAFLELFGDRVFEGWAKADAADRLVAAESMRMVTRLDLHAGFELAPHPPLSVAS